MDDELRGFGGTEVFTLITGPDKQHMSVQKSILLRIPYFRAALSSGIFAESQIKVFDLSAYDAKAIANVLFYVLTGRVERLEYVERGYTTLREVDKLNTYIHAYVLADMWKAESTANALVDEIIRFQYNNRVHPDSISILSSAGLEESALYKFLVADMAYCMLDEEYFPCRSNGEGLPQGHPDEPANSETAFCRLSREDLVRFVAAMHSRQREIMGDKTVSQSGGEYPTTKALNNLCSFHKHESTTKCGDQKRKRCCVCNEQHQRMFC